jgi:prepilin-type N-terminal cleavage/methylation domain-containing protein
MDINSRGFSIIEVMISIAMISIISFAALQVADFYSMATARDDARFGNLRLVSEMRAVLTKRETCLNSLLERNFQPSVESEMRVRLPSGGIVSSSAGEHDQKNYGVDVKKLVLTNKRQLAALPSGETIFATQLRIETDAAKGNAKTSIRGIPVATMVLKIDPLGQISDCMLGETPLDAEALACQAMGGMMVSGTCRLRSKKVEVMCPDGQQLVGFGKEGGAICEAIPGPPPAPACTEETASLGPGIGATPRFWGGFACTMSCIGTHGPGATCAGGCNSGYRGWMYCDSCQKVRKVCR